MASIYASASVTLIAAAGQDAEHGLQGVSRDWDTPDFCALSDRYQLIDVGRRATQTIEKSTWYSRAWTFQECYFARRRVYFLANTARIDCAKDLKRYKEDYPRPVDFLNMLAALPNNAHASYAIPLMMQEYTRRRLTYDSDALNAIIGALESRPEIDHTWGVHVERLDKPNSIISSICCCNAVLYRSSWVQSLAFYSQSIRSRWRRTRHAETSASGLYIALHWYHASPGPRRKDFPSWSPLGWRSQVSHLACDDTSVSSACSLQVWHNGNFKTLRDTFGVLSEQHRQIAPKESKYLKLETRVVILDFEHVDSSASYSAGLYVKVPYGEELDILVLPDWDLDYGIEQQTPGEKIQLPCIVVVRQTRLSLESPRIEDELQIIILHHEGSYYERVGCFSVWGSSSWFARDKHGQTMNPNIRELRRYGNGRFWMKNGEQRTILLG